MRLTYQPFNISTSQPSDQTALQIRVKPALIIQTMRENAQKCLRSKLRINPRFVAYYQLGRNAFLVINGSAATLGVGIMAVLAFLMDVTNGAAASNSALAGAGRRNSGSASRRSP
jgi:hypothetical protein